MKKLLSYLYQLPQNLAGFILSRFAEKKTKLQAYTLDKLNVYFMPNLMGSGVSLGEYVFLDKRYYLEADVAQLIKTISHEFGHTRQSRKLGWLYLLVIGLPSLIGNLLHRVINFNYYKQPWEAWADKLGKVER